MMVARTLEELLAQERQKVRLLERRLASRGGGGGGTTSYKAQPGLFAWYGGGVIPAGWLLCDGSAVSRTAYPQLFGAIGTTYGVGDGSTTFNLPDTRGRTLFGQDAGQAEFDVLGEKGGAKTHSHPLSAAGWAMVSPQLGTSSGIYWRRVTMSNWTPTHYLAGSPTGTPPLTGIGAGAELGGATDAASSLPPYMVATHIISTGEGLAGGGGVGLGAGDGIVLAGSGTVGDPYVIRVADRLSSQSAVFTDCNTVVDNGWYRGSTPINAPTSTSLAFMFVKRAGATGQLIRQEFHRIYADGINDDYRTWVRMSANAGATWTAWQTLQPPIDTGWADLSSYLTGGFSTGSTVGFQGRIIGKDVELRGSITAPALAASSSGVDFALPLPAMYRPTSRIGFGTGLNAGNALVTYCRTDGTCAVSRAPGIAAGSLQFTIKFYIE